MPHKVLGYLLGVAAQTAIETATVTAIGRLQPLQTARTRVGKRLKIELPAQGWDLAAFAIGAGDLDDDLAALLPQFAA